MVEPKPLWSEREQALLDKLRVIRERKEEDFKPLPPSKYLRKEVRNLEGDLVPFTFRYYQVQGILNMVAVTRFVLGDGTGLGKCLTGNTLLVTDRGMVPIEDLAPEGELKADTFYELDRPLKVWTGSEMTAVRRFFWNGEAPTKHIRTRSGYQVEGSLRHPLWARTPDGESFCRIPDVEVGDYLCIDRRPAPFPIEDPTLFSPEGLAPHARVYAYPKTLTPELARLLGYVVAEAWSNGRYTTNISQHLDVNPEAHADIRQLLSSVFGWKGADTQESGKLISVSSVGIRKFLEICGVPYTTSHYKKVPWCIFQGTRESVRHFLRGIFEGEASVADGGVEFSSSSKQLTLEIQQLLLRFGVVTTLSPKYVKGRDHTYWRISFFGEDARIFAQDIGFVSARKQEALRNSFSQSINPNKDTVPYLGEAVFGLKTALLWVTSRSGSNDARAGSGIKQFGESFQSTLKHVIHGKRNPTYNFLRQFLEVCAAQGLESHPSYLEIQKVVANHYFYDPVVDIQEGTAPLMDIEVEHPDHQFYGNGFINHNTIETIGTLCYLLDNSPDMKIVVVAPKSAIRQWKSEIERFTDGIEVHLATAPKGGKTTDESAVEGRQRVYDAWLNATKPSVLILNYAILIRDWNHGGFQPLLPNGKPDIKKPVIPGLLDKMMKEKGSNLTVVFDEATAFKSRRTKTWEVVQYFSGYSKRVYALTATLLKNNLMEGYNIYKAIKPNLFGTQQSFYDQFCYTEMQRVARGQKIPIVVGYKNLDQFKERIELVYLGRPKHLVSKELPTLTTREVTFELDKAEQAKYNEALSGVLELGDGEVREFEDTKALTSLIYCQQIVNSLALLKFKGGEDVREWNDFEGQKVKELSGKEQALLDLLLEELEDEKVIVYTRFASHVPRLMEILKKNKVASVCITGAEKDDKRKAAQDEFQNLKSKTKVIFITAAGSEAINLQAAAGMIFFDMPWSWGDYVQAIGRMIRIGSPHKGVLCFHLLAEQAGVGKERKTIDHHVLGLLKKKKTLIDKVLGEAAIGALKFEKDGSNLRDLIKALQKDARAA